MSELEGLDPDVTLRLLEAAREVMSDMDLEAVLERLLRVAREICGARYAAIGVLDDSRQELERFVTSGIDEQTRGRIGTLPAAAASSGS